ncbi:50S ribosomal protein L35 [Halorhodospira abdelmalekii]|uniref:50S ribosomal protein L35 n=1 Tax=Halorhodospira abdelmalekii TaxID=421629 RepID=UPI001906B206|nr:50S ribosomal protein L35 [Halorhodospira abdelmalekii]MBK1734443.1 50S ribosomal protein L35 [Halorhodospira abdelmalekii]
MPKLKTNRGAAKRFKVKPSGRIVRARSNHSHILTKKDPKRKRRLSELTEVHPSDVAMVRRMLAE